MRIFILGVGAVGSFLAALLSRQGHHISCGDRDPERARGFLGERSSIPVQQVNARDLWSIVKAARGNHLIVNACPAVYNKVVLRAALRLRAHYLDTAAHLAGTPFRVEQLRFDQRFRQKCRTALITAGVAPGLTNLLVAGSADLLDRVETAYVRLYESTESDDPVSQWSSDVSFDEAVSKPPVYRSGRFLFGPRFGERELFRFPPPVGRVGCVLAAQDEVVTLPHVIAMQEMDVKIGGNDIERLRRWYRQGKLKKSRGPIESRFPKTQPPKQVERLIDRGTLRNECFAAAVVVQGLKQGRPTVIRWDARFPSLYMLRRRDLTVSPIAWATAQMAGFFVKHFPRDLSGVHPPETLPKEIRRAVLGGLRSHGIRLERRITYPAVHAREAK